MVLSVGPLSSRCPENSTKNPQPNLLADDTKFKATPDSHFLCLIVPYRNRFEELTEFVPYINNFLNKKNLPHRIFVVSQVTFFLNYKVGYFA
jgi:N-terminal region of glycosyl transferase group 7